MALSLEELGEIQSNANYARYILTNLHVHTPATSWDWNGFTNQTRAASTISVDEFFDALNNTRLELVAITDHNCVSWCQPLIDLAKRARREGKSKLHILPGVEITTYEGPHIIAIFDEDKDVADIQRILIRLGLSGEGKQEEKVGYLAPSQTITITDILEEVENADGAIIAPHVNSKEGLWGCAEFRGRQEILNDRRVRILAAPSGDIKRVEENGRVRLLYKNMDSERIRKSFAFINVSDSHRIDDLELNATWIKMSQPGLDGIKQIVFEPELRVAHEWTLSNRQVQYPKTFNYLQQPEECNHSFLIGIAVDGGMLNGQKVGFSPHQNSIIGRNYAGKSALLDCIRFALDVLPQINNDESFYYRYTNRLRAIIGLSGNVRVYIRMRGNIYCVSRTFTCTRVGGTGDREKLRIDGQPMIYKLWNNEFRQESDLSIKDIIQPEVYPQGEVVKIKDNAKQQMAIVDSLGNLWEQLKQLQEEEDLGEKTLLGEIVDNGQRILSLMERKDNLESEAGDIEQLEGEIGELEQLVNSESYKTLKRWGDVEVLISEKRRSLNSLERSISDLNIPNVAIESENPIIAENDCSDEVLSTFSPDQFEVVVNGVFNQAIRDLHINKSAALSVIRSAENILISIDNIRDGKFLGAQQIISENTISDETDYGSGILERINQKRQNLSERKGKRQEARTIEEEIAKLKVTREELLSEYYQKWQEIRASRKVLVDLIDGNSADNIQAELLESSDKVSYRELLDLIVEHLATQSNRIGNKQAQLDLIAEHTSPQELLGLYKSGDVNLFMEKVPGITNNTARFFLNMSIKDQHLLETCVLGDSLVIRYKKDGEETFTPIDQGLSGGEQALALVSVAMVPKPNPLIIDQPEDELGPALITKDLVDQIRKVKNHRQLIFVTHVPNIPVLADSEQIIYIVQEFHNEEKTSRILFNGALDYPPIVARLLELDGGKTAFQKRMERYASIVK